MKIKELIKVFEQLLPIYKEAYEGDYSPRMLDVMDIDLGICYAYKSRISADHKGLTVFDGIDGYYRNLLVRGSGGYLFPLPDTGKDLKPRIDFMESEIKDLKRLLKKGYTHV